MRWRAGVPRVMYIAIGVIFLGIGIPHIYWRWLETRTFLALDVPSSFSPGQIKTGDFFVNLTGWYHVTANVDSDFSGCQSGLSSLPLSSSTTVYRGDQRIENFKGLDRYLGHFYADKNGRYSVSVDVFSDSSCLNAGHPRIRIWTDSSEYLERYNKLRNVSLVLVIAGLGLLVFSIAQVSRPRASNALSISPHEHPAHNLFQRKPTPKPQFALSRFTVLPSLALGVGLILVGLGSRAAIN
jgi:hypothetical protein